MLIRTLVLLEIIPYGPLVLPVAHQRSYVFGWVQTKMTTVEINSVAPIKTAMSQMGTLGCITTGSHELAKMVRHINLAICQMEYEFQKIYSQIN